MAKRWLDGEKWIYLNFLLELNQFAVFRSLARSPKHPYCQRGLTTEQWRPQLDLTDLWVFPDKLVRKVATYTLKTTWRTCYYGLNVQFNGLLCANYGTPNHQRNRTLSWVNSDKFTFENIEYFTFLTRISVFKVNWHVWKEEPCSILP